MECRICEAESKLFGTTTVLLKYRVSYFRCAHCGFIQTEEPYWLSEAYADPILASDLGLVSRNIAFARLAPRVIRAFFDPLGRFLDYGGGYGMFVRLMRDRGFDFYRHDAYCENLFARDQDVQPGDEGGFELVTALEVFEHLPSPMHDLRAMLDYSANIFFSTTLVPLNAPRPGHWWYYAPEGGQHVSLYTLRSLELMAQRCGLHLTSDGKHTHMLTEKPLPAFKARMVMRYPIADWLGGKRRRKSLLGHDYERLTGRKLA